MTKRELLIREIEEAPEPLLDEIEEAIDLLKRVPLAGGRQTALASEAVLAKDWLRPEEDEAWDDTIGSSLDRFIGTWTAEEEEELLRSVEVFEQVDESLWS